MRPSWRRTPSGCRRGRASTPTPTCRPGSSRSCARGSQWDVLFVLEEDELRRAPDVKHYRLAQQLRRTLVTMDRDYLDDRRFPPEESGGVLVINAPDERQLSRCSTRVDRSLFQPAPTPAALPLERPKLQVNTDWGRDDANDRPVGRRARAARPHPVTRHARRSRAAASSISAPALSRRAPRRFTATTSFPGSSTCTCTAWTAWIRWTRRRRFAAWPRVCRATGSPPSVRPPWPVRPRSCGACSSRSRRPAPSRIREVARVLPAHLESNFINPDYRGAQPLPAFAARGRRWMAGQVGREGQERAGGREAGDTERASTGRIFCARSSARLPMSAS